MNNLKSNHSQSNMDVAKYVLARETSDVDKPDMKEKDDTAPPDTKEETVPPEQRVEGSRLGDKIPSWFLDTLKKEMSSVQQKVGMIKGATEAEVIKGTIDVLVDALTEHVNILAFVDEKESKLYHFRVCGHNMYYNDNGELQNPTFASISRAEIALLVEGRTTWTKFQQDACPKLVDWKRMGKRTYPGIDKFLSKTKTLVQDDVNVGSATLPEQHFAIDVINQNIVVIGVCSKYLEGRLLLHHPDCSYGTTIENDIILVVPKRLGPVFKNLNFIGFV